MHGVVFQVAKEQDPVRSMREHAENPVIGLGKVNAQLLKGYWQLSDELQSHSWRNDNRFHRARHHALEAVHCPRDVAIMKPSHCGVLAGSTQGKGRRPKGRIQSAQA